VNKRQKLIDWLGGVDCLLESQVIGSGLSSTLNALLREGVAEIVEHPTVKDRAGYPVAAVRLKPGGGDHG
jgi:hypothetical protein